MIELDALQRMIEDRAQNERVDSQMYYLSKLMASRRTAMRQRAAGYPDYFRESPAEGE